MFVHSNGKASRFFPGVLAEGRWVPLLVGAPLLAAFSMFLVPRSAASDGERLALSRPRVVVLKSAHRLHLYDGPTLVRIYPVDLGLEPVGDKVRGDDRRTPEGVFRVCTKVADSRFHRFLGIDYPGEKAVGVGLDQHWITAGQADEIQRARRENRCPPWDTSLGGGVGLHGHRRGTDWTAGCIALSNEHIEELFSVLRAGDEIEILP